LRGRLGSDRLYAGLAVFAVIVVLWEATVDILQVRTFLVPAPSAILRDILENWRYFVDQVAHTLYATILGFAIAVLLGLVIAIGIVHSRFIDLTLYTLLVALNSVPKVALAPLFVIWLGTGVYPKVAVSVLIAIFSIVIDAVLGMRSVDPDALSMARVVRASAWQILLKIRLPNALPYLFAGMKVAISFALIGTIVGEFVVGDRGLGAAILLAQGMFDTTRAFAAIVLLGLMGALLFFAVEMVERYCLPWHVSQRAAGGGRGAA